MADLGETNNVSGVFGGVELQNMGNEQIGTENAGTIRQATYQHKLDSGTNSKHSGYKI